MPIYKDENNYKVIKLDGGNQPQDYDLPQDADIATEQEMQDYILNMTPANITANGSSLIIEFEPFPKKYVNYMRQRQYNGRRTQVFWQLVRYTGHSFCRKTYAFSLEELPFNNLRANENNELYHWTFPTRQIPWDESANGKTDMKPYYFNLTPKEATLGKIIWKNGNLIINSFKNRPFGVESGAIPKQIAIIIGLSKKNMLNTISDPLIYKKSQSYFYDDLGYVPQLSDYIYNTEITISESGADYLITFNNVDQSLKDYAEQNKLNNNQAIFLQTFNYFGGQTHGTKRLKDAGTGLDKKIKSPSKNQYHRKNIGLNEFENGVYLSEITQEAPFKKLYTRYKYEPETFHNISVALVLANPGMNEGFHTYKESNKINII